MAEERGDDQILRVSLNVRLSDGLRRRLDQRASRDGKLPTEWARHAIERALLEPAA